MQLYVLKASPSDRESAKKTEALSHDSRSLPLAGVTATLV
jgi:hypothetical protein